MTPTARAPRLCGDDGARACAPREKASVVAISAEPGIGKSRLLDEFAARGIEAAVLRGGSSQAQGMPPYLPFLEALDLLVHIARRLARAKLVIACAFRPAEAQRNPGTGQGISNAFRDAELLANAVVRDTLAEYEPERNARTRPMYDHTWKVPLQELFDPSNLGRILGAALLGVRV